jgi:peptidoglycan/LPS O-acetylase OafA/YrhL
VDELIEDKELLHSVYHAHETRPPQSRRRHTHVGKRFYWPELDTLRVLAFFCVYVHHVIPHEPSFYAEHHFLPHAIVPLICAVAGAGAFGVDLFFALSAYLITALLLREKETLGAVDIRRFYLRRILRIWPLYFVFVAFAAMIPHWYPAQRLPWPYVLGYLCLAGNWVYAWKGLPASVAIPLWSISVEEQFYLAWPLAIRRLSPARMIYVVIGLLFIANLSRILLVVAHVNGGAVEYNTFARIDAIACGILIAYVYRDQTPRLSGMQRAALISSCLLVWFVTAAYGHLNAPRSVAPVLGTIIGRPLVALGAAGILIGFIGISNHFKALANPVLTYLGKISYGLYVYHMAGLLVSRPWFRTNTALGYIAYASVGLLITVMVSIISYHWLESPFLRLKDRYAIVLSRPI